VGNPDPAVIDALASVVRDPKARPAMRCDMVQALGQLKYPPGGKTDVKGLANSVGHETLDLCKAELETAESAKRDPSRRLMSYVLASSMLGLEGRDGRGGLLAGASADNQKFIDDLRAQVKALQTSVDGGEVKLTADMLTDLEGALEPLPGGAPAAPAAPAAQSADKQAAADKKSAER
jgi:hypothetical protein